MKFSEKFKKNKGESVTTESAQDSGKKKHKPDPKKLVGTISKKHIKNGSYSMAMAAIFIVIVVVINMIVGAIPSKYSQLDVSSSKLYTIGDETKKVLKALDKDMMVRILKEPKNAILKQYQKLLALDEVKLEFTDDALDAIAEKAMKRDTGARALRSIIEDFMLDIMYEIPKDDNIGRVTITREYIEGTGGPIIDIRSNEILEPVENLKQIPAEEK